MIKPPGVVVLLIGLCISMPARPAGAWTDTGHRLIALIAWADLTPPARAKFTYILKTHPRYKEDMLSEMPADLSGEDQDRYAFGMAATWPDMVRSFSNPMHATFNHPAWHYIDIPFSVGGQAANLPPDAGPPPHNILEALTFNIAAIKDATVAPKDQAVALCWILHLCGDVHQPLHAAELFSPQYPDGDKGGNAIIVLREPPYSNSQVNLHLLWDQLPGQYKDESTIRDLATGLRSDQRFSREALKDLVAVKDPAAWANESHELAVRVAYLNGDLHGASAAEGGGEGVGDRGGQANIPGVPPGYLKQAEEVAMQRCVVAGYRTADLLNSLADTTKAP